MSDTVVGVAGAAPVVVAPVRTPVFSTIDPTRPAGTVGLMSRIARDRVCVGATIAVLLLGASIWLFGRAAAGLTLGFGPNGGIVVVDVEPGTLGWAAGARPGMSVMSVDRSIPSSLDVPIDGKHIELAYLDGGAAVAVPEDSSMHGMAPALLMLGAIQAAFAWFLRSRGTASRGAWAELMLAFVTPMALVPASAFGSSVVLALAAVAWPLGVLPLALFLAEQAVAAGGDPRTRRLVLIAIALALGLTPLFYLLPGPAGQVVVIREALVAFALLAPVAIAASAGLRKAGAWIGSAAAGGGAARLAGAALAPLAVRMLTLVPAEGVTALVAVLAVGAVAFLIRFGMLPLVRAASTAVRQRDQVSSAAEGERRRLAADLHDGPLQALTMLAYRLEVAGDAQNAQLARDVTTELRSITASLRLPVVDDLGTGPALEWLTERVGHLAGTSIKLEHRQDGRPPREVEHAIFRVAQEALANAARHGRPPIHVRYEADAGHASLIVQDAGDGALVQARDGQGLGIVGMRERAHAIGADIELAQSGTGMKVSLVWPGAAS